ncbi:phosphoethanolamine transferase EptA [Entomomonas asaccharolytica]|uniref:Phosphoethanolamine transferase EptA n=1 Tax=Entomomonas asaccharolytica TaxID=2785331 RepID=A0A974NDJ6_9GAMM|nr:phosphoethanolamine transferase EptA [Entomomonas asaccharolytica]QQP84599.1 phosphoethanolamine transferase EptA [Entomomonas asaccharolytica]
MFNLKRLSCNSLVFVIACAIFFALLQNIAFFSKTIQLLEMDSFTDYLLVGSFFVFILCFLNILFSIILVGFLRKPLIIILLFCSAGANYFSYLYNIYVDKDMIQNVMQTNPEEAGALITAKLVIWLLIFAVLPSILVIFVKINKISFVRSTAYRLANITLSVVLLVAVSYPLYNQYAFFIREKTNNQITKLITPSNYINGLVSYGKDIFKKKLPFINVGEDAKRQQLANHKKKLMIIVVGETSRAMNFSLNGYAKETNPLLKQQDIINFEQVSSCGTATAISVPCMFSVMPKNRYKESVAERQDNLLDILNRTGVNILWKENDGGCKGVCDRVPSVRLKDIYPKESCPDGLCYDTYLLDDLDNYINERQEDTVIVLHTNGSHGPAYYRRYQKAQEKFTPACSTNAVETCSREELVNAYDNTIVNIDYVLNEVIELLKKHSEQFTTAMLYASDHGESLGESGIYLHGMPYSIAPKEQTHIPMIFWLSKDFLVDNKIDKSCMLTNAKNNEASHDNLFHTVLGAMNISTEVYNPKLDLFKGCQNNWIVNN